jgi:YD repeat-containing protein
MSALCAVVLIASCRKNDVDIPKQQAPLLKRTVETNSSGVITRIAYYNEFEQIALDTIFMSGTRNPGMTWNNTYNSKGKLTRSENHYQVIYTAGYYWAYSHEYLNDTFPTVSYRFLKGNQVAKITHIYNSSKQLVMDSTYHTPNYGIFSYLRKFEYDALGRMKSILDLDYKRDSTRYIVYQYFPNKIESASKALDPLFSNYGTWGIGVREFNAAGQIISDKGFVDPVTVAGENVDFTYDATGRLLKKINYNGSTTTEERYYYNSFGRIDKVERYYNNILSYTTTYYYE